VREKENEKTGNQMHIRITTTRMGKINKDSQITTLDYQLAKSQIFSGEKPSLSKPLEFLRIYSDQYRFIP
jgi:hypothetical protein